MFLEELTIKKKKYIWVLVVDRHRLTQWPAVGFIWEHFIAESYTERNINIGYHKKPPKKPDEAVCIMFI